jgi:hypothetical protein
VANTTYPFGFQQRSGYGSAPTYEINTALIDYNTAAIYQGDPVFRLSDSTIAGATTGPGPGTGVLAGIFWGCEYPSVSQGRPIWSDWWPGSDVASGNNATAYIINDPNAQFLVQSDATGIVQGNIGLNVQFAYGTPVSVVGAHGRSGAYITGASVATTSTLPFRLISLLSFPPGANGTTAGAYAQCVVAFNNVETKALTAQN